MTTATQEKTCTKCGKTSADIDKVFGWRRMYRKVYPHSHCFDCRFNRTGKPLEAIITADAKTLRTLYVQYYPRDKENQRRSWRLMATRLHAYKLIPFSEDGLKRYNNHCPHCHGAGCMSCDA